MFLQMTWVLLSFSTTGHASQGVNPQDRASVAQAYRQWALAPVPPLEWTGDAHTCVPGVTSPAHQERVISQINFYRALADLPAVRLNTNTAKYQAAAMLMSANNSLSHAPPPEWRCYSPEAAEGARANLARGISGPRAIDGYMDDDGVGNEAVGHRRWILYSKQVSIATGDTLNTNALGVMEDFRGPSAQVPFIAFPSAGYFPVTLLPSSKRWSIGVPGADFSQASVAMHAYSETSTGFSITGLEVKLLPIQKGFGDNTLVWEASLLRQISTDTSIDVRVSNVISAGVRRDYVYRVVLFRP